MIVSLKLSFQFCQALAVSLCCVCYVTQNFKPIA